MSVHLKGNPISHSTKSGFNRGREPRGGVENGGPGGAVGWSGRNSRDCWLRIFPAGWPFSILLLSLSPARGVAHSCSAASFKGLLFLSSVFCDAWPLLQSRALAVGQFRVAPVRLSTAPG